MSALDTFREAMTLLAPAAKDAAYAIGMTAEAALRYARHLRGPRGHRWQRKATATKRMQRRRKGASTTYMISMDALRTFTSEDP